MNQGNGSSTLLIMLAIKYKARPLLLHRFQCALPVIAYILLEWSVEHGRGVVIDQGPCTIEWVELG